MNQNNENEKEEKFSWKNAIINNLFIAVIVAGATVVMNTCSEQRLEKYKSTIKLKYEKEIEDFKSERNREIEALKHHLDSSIAHKLLKVQIDAKIRSDSQNFENRLTIAEKTFVNGLKSAKNDFNLRVKEIGEEVKGDFKREKDKEKLDFLSKQLQEFYWPILIRLEKNNAVYELLGNEIVGSILDTMVVLSNHLEIVDIIKTKFHLAQPDEILTKEIENYIGHVYTFQSLRVGGYFFNADESGGNDYRPELYHLISDRTELFQKEYNKTVLELNKKDSTEKSFLDLDTKDLYPSLDVECLKLKQQNRVKTDLGYKIKNLEIKLSRNSDWFVSQVDDQVKVSFEGPRRTKNEALIKVGLCKTSKKNPEKCVFKNDTTIGAFVKEVKLSIDSKFNYETKNRFYRVWLRDRWRSENRDRVSLTIEYWNKNVKSLNEALKKSCIDTIANKR